MPLPGGYETLIDDEDVPLIGGFRWRVLLLPGKQYVHAWQGSQHIYMHRLLLGAPKGRQVDHCDGDGLNNQRSNLRLATRSQNHANRGPDRRLRGKSSKYKGVYWSKTRSTWAAGIHLNGKSYFLGHHPTEEAAAAAYDRAAVDAWAEFAKTNFP